MFACYIYFSHRVNFETELKYWNFYTSKKVDTSDAVKKVKNGEKPGKGKKPSTKDDKKSREKSKSPVKSPSKKLTPKKGKENKENKVEKENSKNRSPSRPSVKSSKDRDPMKSPQKSPQKLVNGHKEEQNNNINDLITNGLGNCINIFLFRLLTFWGSQAAQALMLYCFDSQQYLVCYKKVNENF